MPNPDSTPPATTPPPPPPAANQPVPSNAQPDSQAQTKMAAELERMFPGGQIPDGGRFNNEANLMRSAGRDSSVVAAAATPPGSTVNAPIVQPVITTPGVVQPPVAPTAPPTPGQPTQQPTTPAAQTPEEKAATEKAVADKAAADAIKAAAEAGKPKAPLTDAERDAAQAAMTPQAGTAFKNLRHELGEAKKALQAKEAQIAEAQTKLSKTLATEEAVQLKEKLAKAEQKLSVFDYRSTTEYQDQVAVPLTNVEAEIKAIAVKNQISEEALTKALNNPDALAELSTNFNRLDLMRFDKLILAREDYQKFGEQLEAQAQDRLKNYSSIQEAEAARAAEAAKADWSKALDTTQAELAETMPIFKPTGDAQFDADMTAAINEVKSMDLSKLSNADIAKAFYRDKAFDIVLGLVTNLHNKNVELDTRVKQLSGTSVPAGGGHATTVEPTKPVFSGMQDAVRQLIPAILP